MKTDPREDTDLLRIDEGEKAVRDRERRSGWGKPRPSFSLVAGGVMLAVAAYMWWRAGAVDVYALVLALAGIANIWIGFSGLRTSGPRT